MMRLRPATMQDHAAVVTLAELAGIGMTSLPPDPAVLADKIAFSEQSFAGNAKRRGEEFFLLLLEDDEADNQIVGTTGIWAHVGLSKPFYSYKLSTLTQANSEIGVYSPQKVLHMVNDYTGASEIGALFLHPNYRRDGIGRFLSRARFLLMASYQELFSSRVIAEMRGVQDEKGRSPFYNGLAKHFIKVDFQQADYVSATKGNQFIADLMPKYPIYVSLLGQATQAVIGEVFSSSAPARRLLEKEGFRFEGYVDVLDGGPTLQAELSSIHTVCHSRTAVLDGMDTKVKSPAFMICTQPPIQELSALRMAIGQLQEHADGTVTLASHTAERLRLAEGDKIRYIPL